MHKIFTKLQGNRGTSLLMALLFFLICAVTGSLILGAASARGAKSKGSYTKERYYMAVASAARLLKSEIGDYTYTKGRTWQTWDTGNPDPVTGTPIMESGWKDITPFLTPDDGEGGDILTSSFIEVLKGSAKYEKSFDIEAGENIPSVQVHLQMEADGDALFVLKSGDFSMKVSFTARTVRETDYTSYDYETTSWNKGMITKEAE